MAQVSFDAIPESATNQEYSNNVEFFNLKNDGDEAIVRILHDSTDTFNIFTVHDRISVAGKFRKVNCLRDPKQPTEMCPLCASGNNVVNRMYINMLQYVRNQQGMVEAKPVVWERSLVYATKLKSLIDEYGPLSESIFKIKRFGAAGSMDTTYEIMYCNPKMYPEENYPLDGSAFNNYSALGTIILNKKYEDLAAFLATGAFPATQPQNANSVQAAPAPMSYQPKAPETQVPVSVVPEAPNVMPPQQYNPGVMPTIPAPQPQYAPQPQGAPFNPGAPAGGPGRPSPRYY